MKRKRKLSFKKARSFVRKLGIKSQAEWRKYRSKSNFPEFLPSNAWEYYQNKGWTNWYDFLGRSRDLRRHKINDNYFKKWSHNMAYILGFWFTDGCITKGKIFTVSQHRRDKYLLDRFLQEMGSDYPIGKGCGNNLEFAINSKIIYEDIIKLGGKARKSLDVRFPKIHKKYLCDFIRGLWDGDGCIGYHKEKNAYLASFCSGSKVFIYEMRKVLRDNIIGLTGCLHTEIREAGYEIHPGKFTTHDSIYYTLSFCINDTIRLREFMYTNDRNEIKMIRKYKKFISAGSIRKSYVNRSYMSFDDAKKYARKLKFFSNKEWKNFCKSGKKSELVPASLHTYYKNKGYCGIGDFLGYKRNDFISFYDARIFARKLGLKSRREWSDFCKRGNKPSNIPTGVSRIYKNKGWVDWYDWLGTVSSKNTLKTV